MDLPVGVWVLLLVLGIVVLVGMVFAALGLVFRRQMQRAVTDWLAQGIIIRRGPAPVSYRGHASSDIPVRGNGMMALGETELRCVRWVPRSEFVIPLSQITAVALKSSWKGGYTPGSPVLVIDYRTETGEDALGVIVRQPQQWLTAVEEAAHLPPARAS